MAELVERDIGEREVKGTPVWVRVVARPLVVARERPDHSARPKAPVPEGTILGVASRNDEGWLLLDGGNKKTKEHTGSCWVAEKDQDGHASVLPVLPALFAVGDRPLEVKEHPFVDATTFCTFEPGQFFDVISYENQWLKVYYGKTLQYGKWWTRHIGWIRAVEEETADTEDGARVAPSFAHRRGLVPTLQGQGEDFVVASFSSTPVSLYKNSQDRSIQLHLDLLEKEERPIDNKSTRMQRNLEGIQRGSKQVVSLSKMMANEETGVSLPPLHRMNINKPPGNSSLEEIPDFRYRTKTSSKGRATERKVTVECSWYVDAHGGSPVSYLKTKQQQGGQGHDHHHAVVFSGCEKPDQNMVSQSKGTAVIAWDGKDGSLCKSFRPKVPSTVRSIAYDGHSKQVVCVSGEGRVFGFDYESNEEEGGEASALEFDMNVMGGGNGGVGVGAGLEPAEDLFAQAAASSSEEKPKFIRESGFRGMKEDYVFRKGEWGTGYYRKDVIFDVLTFPVSDNIDIENEEAMERARAERKNQRQHLSNLLQICGSAQASLINSSLTRVYHGSPMKAKDDCCIRCYDVGTGEEAHAPFNGHAAGVLCLAIDEEDSRLYSGSYDKKIICWDTGRAEAIRTLEGHTAGVHGICLSKDGATLYSCSSDNSIRAWDVERGECVKSFFGQHAPGTWPVSVSCSPDQRWVASGSKGPFGATSIKLWSAHSSSGSSSSSSNSSRHHSGGTCVCTFSQLEYEEPGAITCVEFSDDSAVVYTGASDGTVAAWRISESTQKKKTTKTALSGFLN